MIKALTIKNISLKHNILAAPMAGYSDLATRFMALKHGASLAFTEMVSCEGLWREGEKSLAIMQRAPNEEHLAVQLFGGNTTSIEKALQFVLKEKPSWIDFNMACPMPKIIRSNSGSALMKNIPLAREILTVLEQNVPSSISFSIKIRSGYDQSNLNYCELAEIAFSKGASMVTMHPRTRSQLYSGLADWSHLSKLKKTFSDKLICGSGDLSSKEAILKMLQETKVDAVMVARASIGNPWIYNSVINNSDKPISIDEKIVTAYQHYTIAMQYFSEHYVSHELKKHLLSYLKGIAHFAPFRSRFALAKGSSEILAIFDELNDFCQK